jgi:hypothetical protein
MSRRSNRRNLRQAQATLDRAQQTLVQFRQLALAGLPPTTRVAPGRRVRTPRERNRPAQADPPVQA